VLNEQMGYIVKR